MQIAGNMQKDIRLVSIRGVTRWRVRVNPAYLLPPYQNSAILVYLFEREKVSYVQILIFWRQLAI